MNKLVHSFREFACKTGINVAFYRMLDVVFLVGVLVFFVSQMSDFTHILLSPYISTVQNITTLRAAALAVKTFRK